MQAFLGRLKEALDARELVLKGITTDGSALYPEAIRAVFREVLQQPCTFHVIAELVKGVRSAVAQSASAWRAKAKPCKSRSVTCSKGCVLFVKRRLRPSERHRLLRIPRGLSPNYPGVTPGARGTHVTQNMYYSVVFDALLSFFWQ